MVNSFLKNITNNSFTKKVSPFLQKNRLRISMLFVILIFLIGSIIWIFKKGQQDAQKTVPEQKIVQESNKSRNKKTPTPTATVTIAQQKTVQVIATITPTSTPQPTNTPTPVATNTPVPTETPSPTPVPQDTTAPTIQSMTGPADGSTVDFNTFCFPIQASDDRTSGVNMESQYKFDSDSWTDWKKDMSPCFSDVSNGSHSFTVHIKDEAGNISSEQNRTFTVDKN